MLSRTAVSAPGKVFLAGGYLVLDRDYTALVFGLNARIHVVIKPLATSSGVSLSEIIVKSPQFLEAAWEYGYRVTENDGGVNVTQLTASASDPLRRNPFIETTLSFVLTYISSLGPHVIDPASISILADNDYYSDTPHDAGQQQGQGQGPDKGKRFKDFHVPIWEAHKTGLGSSAALVTAFTAALLTHYLPEDVFSLNTDGGRRRLHNLAQASHCAAQGKVGSGFDVASACYGSCVYRRFSPSTLQSHGDPGSPGFAKRIGKLVDEVDWDTEITKSAVKVPQGLRLVMCDVDCGSQTPGMVKQVLAWRKENPDVANKLWNTLQQKNERLSKELVQLTERKSYDFSTLRVCVSDIRALIREMSTKSGVPIEPPEQTALLDACSIVPGVVGGVVPGAGGYDAVALLIEDKEEVIARLNDFLANYTAQSKGDPKEGAIGKVSLLGVREDMEGVRVEDFSAYGNWIST